MFKHIHSRYVIAAIAVVTLAFTLTGIAFFISSAHSGMQKKKAKMEETVKYSESLVATAVDRATPAAERQLCYNALSLVCDLSGTEIIVSDISGLVIYSTTDVVKIGTVLNLDSVKLPADNSSRYMLSTVGGAFPQKQFVIPNAIYASGGAQIGTFFVTSDAGDYTSSFISSFHLFILSSLGVLVLTSILIFYFTKRQLKPFKAMGDAAQKYAHGDFKPRIEKTGIEEFDELVVAFNNMAESLSRLEDTRRSFLQNVSHDMRTPMTAISGFVDGMLDGTIPPEQYGYYLGLVSAEAKRLTRLVSTMLEMSEIENNAEEKKAPFDICELSTRVILSFENKFVTKNLKLKMDIPPQPLMCIGNSDSLYRVVYNLVENAIKYAFDDGSVSVSVAENENFAIVSVHNTGMGIKADDLPFVFDRFYKADKSRGLDTNSMGLGLYITKTLVEKNGGNITARSQYGKFCEFSFTVPLNK